MKSSSLYIRNSRGAVTAILAINYDISDACMMRQRACGELHRYPTSREQTEPEKIINVNDVLDELIQQSVALVGKPVALMNKDDKIRAIRFLNEQRRVPGHQVRRQGGKILRYFQVYTLFLYRCEQEQTGGKETWVKSI